MGSALFALGIVMISRIDTTLELEHILFGDVLQLTEIGFNFVIGGLAVAVVLLLFSLLRLSMLVTPAATARLVSPTLRRMTIVGVGLGVSEGLTGVVIGRAVNAPPGATIGLLAAVVFAIAYAMTLPRRMPHHHRPFV